MSSVSVPFEEVVEVTATAVLLDLTGSCMFRSIPVAHIENLNWREDKRVEVPEWFAIKEDLLEES